MQWEDKHMSFNFDVKKGPVHVEWFQGATTNLCVNCLDRNMDKGLGDNKCFIWEGNDPSTYSLPFPRFSPLVLCNRTAFSGHCPEK